METGQQCLGGTDGDKYASPMPVIGVYIFGATLVCLLFLVLDVVQKFRRKCSGLPCRFFSLNSLTLTLLGISAKLPVDLTSPMPSFQDQLSKLSSTLMICISMGFFMPSLAEMEGFELYGNMISLTILVVTLIVNISIQMGTGLILSFFFPEHLIAMILLLLTLIAMWYVTFIKNWILGLANDSRSNSLKANYNEDEGALSEVKGLRHNFEASYRTNPQLALCLFTNYVTYVAMLSTLCLGVLAAVFIRSYVFNHIQFCDEESDYKWSMWMLVGSQILTSVVGTIAIMYRSVFIACKRDKSIIGTTVDLNHFRLFAKIISEWRIESLPWYLSKLGVQKILRMLEELVILVLFATQICMGMADYMVTLFIQSFREVSSWLLGRDSEDSILRYLETNATKVVTEWIRSCQEDYPKRLIQLLSETYPSENPGLQEGCHSCLLLVFLVRVVDLSLPSDHSTPLREALEEVFEIIYFIDKRMISSVFNNHLSRKVAKDLWTSREFNGYWFEKEVINSLLKRSKPAEKADLNDAIETFQEFTKLLDYLPLVDAKQESLVINQLIEKRGASIDNLCNGIKQQFVDILYILLPQLPGIISEYVSQSPAAEREERLKIALKFMCKFDQLKPRANWLFSEVKAPKQPLISADAAPPTTEDGEENSEAAYGEHQPIGADNC